MGINLSDREGLCVAQFVTWVLELCEATKIHLATILKQCNFPFRFHCSVERKIKHKQVNFSVGEGAACSRVCDLSVSRVWFVNGECH